MTRITTAGNTKPWEHRPSDHTRSCGYRKHVHGAILPMEEPSLWSRLFSRRG